jgi:hypothetical protein
MGLGTLIAGVLSDLAGAVAITALFNFTAFGIALSVLVFSPRMRNLRLSELGEARQAV